MPPADGTSFDPPRAISVAELSANTHVETTSPFEVWSRWELPGYRASEVRTSLRSGLTLTASSCRWAEEGALVVDQVAAAPMFLVSRGPGLRFHGDDGAEHHLGGGRFQLARFGRPHRARYEAPAGSHDEVVCLDVAPARLAELLGCDVLPAALTEPTRPDRDFAAASYTMTPALFTLLDEILHGATGARGRQLYLEGKGLELLARLVDELTAAFDDERPRLTAHDVERLQRARTLLLARLEDPPSLPALARAAGLNEHKLKAGFRALFGDSVYGVLRAERLGCARRMLVARSGSVSEIAVRVGYRNPSKFAAAFRAHFGVSPSSIR